MNTTQQVVTEAIRCLQCFEAPCISACPAHIDIPRFISMIQSGDVIGAAATVKQSNALANICGSVCPEEVFCQSVCNRGKMDAAVRIRELHFYATQHEAQRGFLSPKIVASHRKRIAVVGAGPAGLGCAFELAKYGHAVTVFEQQNSGGVPATSIPSFRLSPAVIESDLTFLSRYVKIEKRVITNQEFARLPNDFAAVYVAVGLGADRGAEIPGENMRGVYPVLPYLERSRRAPQEAPQGLRVVVIGGGNVSLDAAATAKRLGAHEVILLYRRSEREMRVWRSELDQARAAGVELRCLTVPVEIHGEQIVRGIRCRKTKLSDRLDSSGRPVPVEVPGSDHEIVADQVIIAIGQVIAPHIFPAIARDARGYFAVDVRFMTSVRGVFAGGDAIAGEGTIVQSVAQGKAAARAIHEFVSTSS